MNRYLDFFLFQTFTGMAYSDAKSFDYEQHIVTIDGKDYIYGHRIKTGNEFVTPVLPITRKILERNNYKMEITSNQKYNQFLKGIGLALNCSFPLTTHIARHTFVCTVALGQGISKEVLQFMMGIPQYRQLKFMQSCQCNMCRRILGIRCSGRGSKISKRRWLKGISFLFVIYTDGQLTIINCQ